MFVDLAPEAQPHVHVVENGVDGTYFSPDASRPTPYRADETPIVFTGAMNYWPNIDGVCWFASEILPRLVARDPSVRFYVVGMNPAPTVEALARDPHIVVTGRVPDVRPYVEHARLVVAPLRVARGIQNKVLEAMAMGRPVLVSAASAEGLSGRAGSEFEIAGDADEFVARATALLNDRRAEAMGRRAREKVLAERDWSSNLTVFERLLQPAVEVRTTQDTMHAQVEHAR